MNILHDINKLDSSTSEALLESFDHYIAPQLDNASQTLSLPKSVDFLANAEHELFIPFIKAINSDDHFSLAFWRMANYSLPIAKKCSKLLDSRLGDQFPIDNFETNRRVLWVVKGPFSLAHMDIVKNFMYGRNLLLDSGLESKVTTKYFALFLDEPSSVAKHYQSFFKSISLSHISSTFAKLVYLRKIIIANRIDTIIWPGVFQNLTFYLGGRHASQQIFWSAKHRSQVFPDSIDKYFFGGYHYSRKLFNGVEWCYGRFDLTPWKHSLRLNPKAISQLDPRELVPDSVLRLREQFEFVYGSICVESKYSSEEFWSAVDLVLDNIPTACYLFAGRVVLPDVQDCLDKLKNKNRIYFIGWVKNIDLVLACFDVYLDAFPFGSGHVLYQCWRSRVPTISLKTPSNLNLTVFHSLKNVSVLNSAPDGFNFPGLVDTVPEYCFLASSFSSDKTRLAKISEQQYQFCNDLMGNSIGMFEDFQAHIRVIS